MNRLLERQLKRLGLDGDTQPADAVGWREFLRWIDRILEDGRQERDLPERAPHISSRQMQELHNLQPQSSANRIAAERNRFKAALQSLTDGLCILDTDLQLRFVNPAGEYFLGVIDTELQGLPVLESFEIHRPNDPAAVMEVQELRQSLLDGVEVRDDNAVLTVHGQGLPVACSLTPILEEKEITGVLLVFRDISGQKQVEADLIRSKEEAESANRAKSEFLSRMSHDLRTPLNAILGFGQILELDNERTLTSPQKESVEEIIAAGHHLLQLINEILDLARIEAGRVNLSAEPVAYGELLDECLGLIVPLAQTHGIEIEYDKRDFLGVVVEADRTRLKQVLLNLLSNAVKFNREDGKVWVEPGQGLANRCSLKIRDTGAGIPPNKLAKLFQPFERLERDFDIEGTGIGLVIAKNLIEMMLGAIGVESELGVGSTFWIELPQVSAPSDETAEDRKELVDRRQVEERAPSPVLLLYVEDNPSNLKLMERMLTKRPEIRLLAAPTPSLGLELASTHHPDLILLDIQLPDMDGYEVLKRLQANADTRDIPVMAISANAMLQDIERGREAGFQDYLTKPLDIKVFFEKLDWVLGNRGDSR